VKLLRLKKERGQIWVLLAMSLTVLLVFTGLAIDLGLAYVAKTTLSKAVDAAALTAMQNIDLGTGSTLPSCGTSPAETVALDAFNVNYKSVPNLTTTTPTPSICFSLDSNNNTIVTVSATAQLSTYFIRILGSSYNMLNISASATAQRNPLIMSLVLDISYSMSQNGGEAALPPAVEDFLADFNGTVTNSDTIDHVAMITFGTSGQTDVPMASPFQNAIDSAVEQKFWAGGVINYTNSQAGLLLGQTQIANQYALVTPGENVVRVLVFFTDGWPNMQQDTLTCPPTTTGGKTTTANLLYCGCDPGDHSLGLCNQTGTSSAKVDSTTNSLVFFNPSSCSTANDSCTAPTTGCGSSTNLALLPQSFPDQQAGGASEPLVTGGTTATVLYCGGQTPLSEPLASDAMYRATQVATNPTTGLLAQGVFVYAIGMGSAITGQPAAEQFLEEITNENDPSNSTYNSNWPAGQVVYAPCATAASCQQDVKTAFQYIYSKIALRLSR